MLYAKRTVRCSAARLTKEAARESLSRQFEEAEILELKREGNKWVATLLEPKEAEFPPKKDDPDESDAPPFVEDKDEDEAPADDGPPSDDDEGPKPPKEEKGDKGGEKGEIAAVLDILTAIADKLGITPGLGAPGADDALAPPPPPPGPPGPSPGAGGPNELVHRTKLKPGETPPGGTPVGAPAFASTNNDLSRLASFDAFDDTPGKTIKEAHQELTELYGPQGFAVRQIKRVEGGRRLAAKLSRR